MINVSVINSSTCVSDADVNKYMLALQMQVNRDFSPIWNIFAHLTFVPKGQTPPPNTWWLVVLDDSDSAGSLGYHDLTSENLPIAKVFAHTDITYGYSVSVTMSHELLEVLADPYINLTVLNGANLYAYENCDACEDDSLGYEIDGVLVSDFVFPTWFQGGTTGLQYDFCKHITAPYQLLKGGYIGMCSLTSNTGWTQLTNEVAHSRGANNPPIGSRRERRTVDRSLWKKSEVKPVV